MAATKRIQKELQDIRNAKLNSLYKISADDSNIYEWRAVVVPDCAPYSKGAFKIDIVFTTAYPFKSPKLSFRTKIYHPNIDEKGQVCLPILSSEHWKPSTKMIDVMKSLLSLINEPEPDNPLRADLAEEYKVDNSQFMRKAEEFTKKYAEKRPNEHTEILPMNKKIRLQPFSEPIHLNPKQE